jgi:hypothetical protein
MRERSRRPDEHGQIAGLEALAFGLLLFVIVSLMIANAWSVIDAKMAAAGAAREAARAYVEAPSGDEADGRAHDAAREAIAGHGRNPARMTVSRTGAFSRCARVVFEVRYPIPTLTLPWIGGLGDGVITATARHSEIVDPYRSGLPGGARCE